MVHLISCLWYGTANFNGFPYNCWVKANAGFEDHSPIYKYLLSIYWSFQTVTTVGYGDSSWGNGLTYEYAIAIIWMIVGVSFYSFSVGNVSSMIASSDSKAAILSKQMKTLVQYATRINLNNDLLERITRYLENHNQDNDSLEEQEKLFQNLPPALRSEVIHLT